MKRRREERRPESGRRIGCRSGTANAVPRPELQRVKDNQRAAQMQLSTRKNHKQHSVHARVAERPPQPRSVKHSADAKVAAHTIRKRPERRGNRDKNVANSTPREKSKLQYFTSNPATGRRQWRPYLSRRNQRGVLGRARGLEARTGTDAGGSNGQ